MTHLPDYLLALAFLLACAAWGAWTWDFVSRAAKAQSTGRWLQGHAAGGLARLAVGVALLLLWRWLAP